MMMLREEKVFMPMFCKTVIDLTFILVMNSYCCFSNLLRNVCICCPDFLICDILNQTTSLFNFLEGRENLIHE